MSPSLAPFIAGEREERLARVAAASRSSPSPSVSQPRRTCCEVVAFAAGDSARALLTSHSARAACPSFVIVTLPLFEFHAPRTPARVRGSSCVEGATAHATRFARSSARREKGAVEAVAWWGELAATQAKKRAMVVYGRLRRSFFFTRAHEVPIRHVSFIFLPRRVLVFSRNAYRQKTYPPAAFLRVCACEVNKARRVPPHVCRHARTFTNVIGASRMRRLFARRGG